LFLAGKRLDFNHIHHQEALAEQTAIRGSLSIGAATMGPVKPFVQGKRRLSGKAIISAGGGKFSWGGIKQQPGTESVAGND